MNKKFLLLFSNCAVLFFALSMLTGCSSAPKHDPEFAPSLPVVDYRYEQNEELVTGGIYKAGQEIILFEDLKARRIGDTITINLQERTNATKSAITNTARTQETSVTNPTLYGSTPLFSTSGLIPLVTNDDNTLQTELSSDHSFSGTGISNQSNSLTGDITVTVSDVLANGNLVVRGEKRLNFNEGNEYIKIAGIVRPYDIGPDNTLASTKLADATIVYSGDGTIADSNRMGWLARFFIGKWSLF
ncbi:MAG: flagellar basal body L-ring protein FlgH [Gammaproteobacteria bacterium]